MAHISAEPDRAGRGAAIAVWSLYLLSLPSLALFALIGVVIAYASRNEASAWASTHFDEQIRIWWIAFLWNVAIGVVFLVGLFLSIVLIGIPLMWIAGLAWFVVMVWFSVKSLFGLIRLLEGQAI